jgi:hypothetical protein
MIYDKLDFYFDIEQLSKECNFLLENIGLHENHNQISLTHTNFINENKWYQGCGSLTYQFNGSDVTEKQIKLTEKDFSKFNNDIKDFYIKAVYDEICSKYKIGRVRLMSLQHKKVMSMHNDTSMRIHIPIVTNENCMMVVDGTVFHMPADGSAFLVDTTKPHTAFNANHKFTRLHLLFDLHD